MIITPQVWIQEPDILGFGLLLAEAGLEDSSFAFPVCTVDTTIYMVKLGEPQDFKIELFYLSKRKVFANEAAYEKWFRRPFNEGSIEAFGLFPADGRLDFEPRPMIRVTAKVVKIGDWENAECYQPFNMMTLACLGQEFDVFIYTSDMEGLKPPKKGSIFCGELRVTGAPIPEKKPPRKGRRPKEEPAPAEALKSGPAFDEPEILREYPVAITSTFRMSKDRSRIAIIDDFNNIYGWCDPANGQFRLDIEVNAGMVFLHAEPAEKRSEIESQLLRFFRHTPPGDSSHIKLYYPDHGKLVLYSNGAIWSVSVNPEDGSFVIPVTRCNEDSNTN